MTLYKIAVRRHDYHVDYNILAERILSGNESAILTERFRVKFEKLHPDVIGAEMLLTLKDENYQPSPDELSMSAGFPSVLEFIK